MTQILFFYYSAKIRVIHILCVLLSLLSYSSTAFGQDVIDPETIEYHEDHEHVDVPVFQPDLTHFIRFWRITERTGAIIPAQPDTFLTDYFNRTNVEGKGTSVAYLGNLGLPMESRVFFDREERSDFMFWDTFYGYSQTPGKFNFINTKIPYSNIAYQTAGSRMVREERLQALLALNAGKKLNFGFDVDYLYARSFYNSQASKHLEWVFFGNYISDRYQVHLFINPADYTNAENGGIENDYWITHPDQMGGASGTRNIPTNLNNVWNNVKGNQVYLNYRYNLGFQRETTKLDEEGNPIKQFVPVSSIIYTFDYKDKSKTFYTTDSAVVNKFYDYRDFFKDGRTVRDSTSYNSLSNTLGLALREGFSKWAKFDLTAFIKQDVRNFTLMDIDSVNSKANQSSTYIGGELAKPTGKILRYNAQGSLGVLGYNLGDVNLSGNIETRIPVWGDTASITGKGAIKRLSPTFYENHYRSKYFWWDNDFDKVNKVYFGGSIDIPHTNTNFSLGVENINNYIYFDFDGFPKQDDANIQILAAQLNQNFQFKALHWDNKVVYQTSSNQDVIPLPDLAAYSSLYIQFKIAKVLTVQMGANVHYWTKYYAPSYEPATQQFKLQNPKDAVKVGNYPLISGFINCHLKQTRFFIQYYNAGAQFISPPEYFSLPHYPVNPTVIKMGLSVDFLN
jgi:hypothetical protein